MIAFVPIATGRSAASPLRAGPAEKTPDIAEPWRYNRPSNLYHQLCNNVEITDVTETSLVVNKLVYHTVEITVGQVSHISCNAGYFVPPLLLFAAHDDMQCSPTQHNIVIERIELRHGGHESRILTFNSNLLLDTHLLATVCKCAVFLIMSRRAGAAQCDG